MKALIKEICDKVGPRIAGSRQEAQAAELIAQRLGAVSDQVTTEEVRIHVGVLAGLINLLVAGVLLVTVLYWFVPLAASILLIAVLLVTYLSRLRQKDVIDVFLQAHAPGDWLMLPGLLGAALTVLIRQLTVGSVLVPGAGDNLQQALDIRLAIVAELENQVGAMRA